MYIYLYKWYMAWLRLRIRNFIWSRYSSVSNEYGDTGYHHVETRRLICITNQMIGFYMKGSLHSLIAKMREYSDKIKSLVSAYFTHENSCSFIKISRYKNIFRTLSMSFSGKLFSQILYLRCFTGFWVRFCVML